jgi:hypothetical protein
VSSALIAETGVDMTRFHRSHIWHRGRSSARKPTSRPVRRHLPRHPATCAWPDAGKQKAIVATGNSVLTVFYHLLSNPDATFCDLGPGITNPGSTNTAAPATSPPSSRRSPASTPPSATAKQASPTPPPDPKHTAAQHHPATPGASGLLPAHHPIRVRIIDIS